MRLSVFSFHFLIKRFFRQTLPTSSLAQAAKASPSPSRHSAISKVRHDGTTKFRCLSSIFLFWLSLSRHRIQASENLANAVPLSLDSMTPFSLPRSSPGLCFAASLRHDSNISNWFLRTKISSSGSPSEFCRDNASLTRNRTGPSSPQPSSAKIFSLQTSSPNIHRRLCEVMATSEIASLVQLPFHRSAPSATS